MITAKRHVHHIRLQLPILVTLLLALLLVGCSLFTGTKPHQRRPLNRPATASPVGVHMLLTDGGNDWPQELWASHLREARAAVGPWGYVIVLLRLDDLDPVRWQHFMDLCTELELTPVFRLATTHVPGYGWSAPPVDDEGYYRYTAALYANLIATLEWPSIAQTGGHFVIVGNEPNRGDEWVHVRYDGQVDEWASRPNPLQYARFLVDAATVLHAADADVRILNAGFDLYAPHTGGQPLEAGYFMDAETFMDEMVAAVPDVFSHVDVWSSHSYPLGPFAAEPGYQRYQRDMVHGAENPNHNPPPEGIYNRGISAYRWELFKLASYGITDLPVIITETGWRHSESVHAEANDGMDGLPDVDAVAAYMQESLNVWQRDERLHGVVFFAFDGHPHYWGHTNWVKLSDDGQVLGRYQGLFGAVQQGR